MSDNDNGVEQQPVLVIMGVSGSGKSTVAALLAGQLGWDLEEGDDLHPAANVAKMAAGHPLNDEDRWPWLDTVASWINEHTMAGLPGVITCSALKRIYRDKLRGAHVVFVHLSGSKDQIGKRLAARLDHYMPTSLLDSQIATLEPPGPDENTLVVDVGRKPADEAAEIIRRLHLVPAAGSSTLGADNPGLSTAPPLGALWADTHEADTHEADTHEADTHEADTHEADTHDADTRGADTYGADTHQHSDTGSSTG